MRVQELFKKVDFEDIWNYINRTFGSKNPALKDDIEKVFESVKKMNCHDGDMLVCLYEDVDDDFINVSGIALSDIDNIDDDKLVNVELYALELSTFSEWASWIVSEYSIKKFGYVTCASEILWEMTFISCDEDKIMAEKEELINISKENQNEEYDVFSNDFVIKENIESNVYRSNKYDLIKKIIKMQN